MIAALKYYMLLLEDDDANKQTNADIFIEFIAEIYDNVLDDYNYLFIAHKDKLNEIRQLFFGYDNVASINRCKFTRRHFECEHAMHCDSKMQFYCDLFDTLFFNIFQLNASGLRVSQANTQPNDESDDTTLVDKEFARVVKAIRQSDGFTTEFERISPQSNSKFDLKVSVDKGDTTTIDQLFVYLIDNEFGKQKVEKLKRFLQNNQFDSDCLNEDGLAHIEDNKCLALMREFIQKLKS